MLHMTFTLSLFLHVPLNAVKHMVNVKIDSKQTTYKRTNLINIHNLLFPFRLKLS